MGNCFYKARTVSNYKSELMNAQKIIQSYDIHLENWVLNNDVFLYLKSKYSQKELKPFESRIYVLVLRNDKLLDDIKSILDNPDLNNSEHIISITSLVEMLELQKEDQNKKIVVLTKGNTLSKVRRVSYVKYTNWFQTNVANRRRLSQSSYVNDCSNAPSRQNSESIEKIKLSKITLITQDIDGKQTSNLNSSTNIQHSEKIESQHLQSEVFSINDL